MPQSRKPITIVGLFIALVVPLSWGWLLPTLTHSTMLTLEITLILECIFALAILGITIFFERLPLSSIRFIMPTWREIAWGLLFFVMGTFGSFFVSGVIVQALHLNSVQNGVKEVGSLPLGVLLVLPFIVGFCEEVLFRGYGIERLLVLTRNLRWGVPLSYVVAWVLFTLAHIAGFGIGGALQVGMWTLVVIALYAWKRNLPICMLMHFLNAVWAYVVVPIVFYHLH